MKIRQSGSQPSTKGRGEYFTGAVRIDCGLVQSWGGPVRKVRPGDVVWCPPGEKHWHGATATTGTTGWSR